MFFGRRQQLDPAHAALGTLDVAMPVQGDCLVGAAHIGLLVGPGGALRRHAAGSRFQPAAQERGWLFHPGPYRFDIVPYAGAPEIGLRLRVVVDAPDPAASEQRFDLFLASEGGQGISAAALHGLIEQALRRELAQGHLDLPACTTLDEWHAFSAALGRLLYQRFGLSIEDCVPVDLADQVDYAALLLARLAPSPGPVPVAAMQAAPPQPMADDAHCLRRLFLELPRLLSALRLAPSLPDRASFQARRVLWQRLEMAELAVNSMPAQAWEAPNLPLAADQVARRQRASACALAALDDAWALLARVREGASASLHDDAERIVANLEQALAERRLTKETA